MSNRKVAYFYDDNIGNFNYGKDHPMKPFRIKVAHELIVETEVYEKMNDYRPHIATDDEICQFHSRKYLKFLSKLAKCSPSEKEKITEYKKKKCSNE